MYSMHMQLIGRLSLPFSEQYGQVEPCMHALLLMTGSLFR